MKTLEEIRELNNLRIIKTGVDGGCGEIQYGRLKGTVIWSNGGGWEHVSIAPYNRNYTPSWSEMCKLKEMFFRPEEWVVQFHPAETEYVNNVGNCLHLWRPITQTLPTPPAWMVGLKGAKLR